MRSQTKHETVEAGTRDGLKAEGNQFLAPSYHKGDDVACNGTPCMDEMVGAFHLKARSNATNVEGGVCSVGVKCGRYDSDRAVTDGETWARVIITAFCVRIA